MGLVTKGTIKDIVEDVSQLCTHQVSIFLIGSISAVVGYEIEKVTLDVDSYNSIESEFLKNWTTVTKNKKIQLPIGMTAVFFPPDGFESRCILSDISTEKIKVYYLEKHDFAISKINRGIQKDIDDILSVHKNSRLDFNTLLDRFSSEFIDVVYAGNKRLKTIDFLQLVELLFGEDKMNEARIKLKF